jgi:4-diphosphocytidyl-2-C-methyl-D-erythritol kinase
VIQPSLSGRRFVLHPPSKINLHLIVGNKRTDGFHGLESIFAALDFGDIMHFSLLSGKEAKTTLVVQEKDPLRNLSLNGQHFPLIPEEENIVYRAVELFRAKTGFASNLLIKLVKRVPPGSGLGGGSSDAASVLLVLNNFSGGALSRNELLSLAIQLGSDVPFFIEIALRESRQADHCAVADAASPARAVSGRGEIFRYLPPPPPMGVLLVFPGFASNTGFAFGRLDEWRQSGGKERNQEVDFLEKINNPAHIMNFSWSSPETWNFTNNFLDLFLNCGTEQEKNAYRIILKELKLAGASFIGLSGSGSACFGIFSDLKEAKKTQKKLTGTFYSLRSTFFLRFQ